MRRTKGEIKVKDSNLTSRSILLEGWRQMISIRKSMSELERCQQERTLAMECYLAAIRNSAQYAVELDDSVTAPHREYLGVVAEDVSLGTKEALEESRATLRGLLRDYRDKAARYLNDLRDELA